MSGNPVSDFFYMGSPGVVPTLAKKGLFLPLEEIDTIPAGEDQVIPIEKFKAFTGFGGKTYGFATDAAVDKIGVFYNRKLFADNGYPDPHTWISTKEWTWDKFQEIAKNMTKDTNGDGTNEQWGVMTYAGDWVWFVALANGGTI